MLTWTQFLESKRSPLHSKPTDNLCHKCGKNPRGRAGVCDACHKKYTTNKELEKNPTPVSDKELKSLEKGGNSGKGDLLSWHGRVVKGLSSMS